MRKYILLFLIFFFCTPVYAAEFNMNSYTSASNGGTRNRYRATEIYNTGMSSTFTFGTRYNGRISDIETYFDYPFVENTTYRLTYNMATEDFRNNFEGAYWWDCDDSSQVNPYRSSVSYISYKKIQVTFTPLENTTCIRMWVRSTSLSNTAITGISNWSLTNITIYDPDWQSGSGSGQGTSTPPPTSSTNNNDDIINNQNENTQDIIDNNNENTEKITDSIDNINYICKKSVNKSDIRFTKGAYLENNGTLINNNTYYYTSDFIKVSGDSITFSNITGPNYHLLYYNSDRNLISSGLAINATSYTLPTGTSYIRFSLNENNYNNFNLTSNGCIYLDRDTIINGNLTDINDSITNDNIDDNTGFFTSFTNDMHGLSSIITIPLTTIQSLANTSCVALTLPIPFTNDSINLPCMSELYDTHAHDIYYLWQIVSFGIISYYICLDIFKMVKGFKDPNEDKIEVLDL